MRCPSSTKGMLRASPGAVIFRVPRTGPSPEARTTSTTYSPEGLPKKAKPSRSVPSLAPGDRVVHDSFGMGTVVATEGTGEKAVASIDFGSEGVKRLLLRYAPVEKL